MASQGLRATTHGPEALKIVELHIVLADFVKDREVVLSLVGKSHCGRVAKSQSYQFRGLDKGQRGPEAPQRARRLESNVHHVHVCDASTFAAERKFRI